MGVRDLASYFDDDELVSVSILFHVLALCMLGNFSCFCCRLLTFFKNYFFENSFRNNISEHQTV